MFCISISHRNTPADVRERFAFSEDEQREFVRLVTNKYRESEFGSCPEKLKQRSGGCVVLSTCNRTEIYYSACHADGSSGVTSGEFEREADAYGEVERLLAGFKGISVQKVRKYCMRYDESQSTLHLFRVACGMDSMVLGEVEIIRQVKSAYLLAKEESAVDSEINLTFQGALAAAKQLAATSDVTRLPVSVGTLSARKAVSFCKENVRGRGGHVLVVGATGRIGSIVARDVADMAQDIEVVGTSRSRHMADELFTGRTNIRLEPYDRRYELLSWADVIVSATGSPHYTFVRDDVEAALTCEDDKELQRGEKGFRERLFLDLAIPKDVDLQVAELPGCTLFDIDYIRTLSRENNEGKAKTLREAEPFVRQRADETRKNVLFSRFNRERGEAVARLRATDTAKLVYELKDGLDCDTFERVLSVIAGKK